MIILTLRTDKPEAEIGLYDDETPLVYKKWEAHRQLAETLHHKIQDILKTQNKEWDSIESIVVYEGPGSFTGLRIGISVANALSYSLNIPIVSAGEDDWIGKGIDELKLGANNLPITPFYGSDANITTPKK